MKKFLSSLFSSEKKQDNVADNDKTAEKNFDVLKYDGVRAMQIRQVSYAIKCFTEALKIKPDYDTMFQLMSAYSMTGELENALDVVDEMLELKPENVNTMLVRTGLLFMLDRDAEVIPQCEQVLQIEPDNFSAYLQMGKAKRAMGQLTEAVTDFTDAITLNEEHAESYMLRAKVYLEMSATKEALADVNKLISLEPENEHAYLLRGRIYEQKGDDENALNNYEATLGMNPFDGNAWLLAGHILIKQGRYEEAIKHLDEAIEVNSEFAQAYIERARAKKGLGDEEGAAEDMKRSAELTPENDGGQQTENETANFDDIYKGGIF